MTALDELISILSDPAINDRLAQAKINHTCKICSNPAEFFRDASAQFEYEVSAICQDCQDTYFTGRPSQQPSPRSKK